jgi:hypothetical protein
MCEWQEYQWPVRLVLHQTVIKVCRYSATQKL